MPEILQFKVTKADAEYDGERLKVRLWYPENPSFTNERIQANPRWGVKVLDNLIRKGHSELANEQNPTKPPSAGSVLLFSDGAFVTHRRDSRAPVHKNYFSTSSGFPSTNRELYSREGLLETALRETAEEVLLLTRETPYRLIVSPQLKRHNLETARHLGFNFETLKVEMAAGEGSDLLEVYDHQDELIYRIRTILDVMFDTDTSLNILQTMSVPLNSEEVISLDGEGMETKAGFRYFQRESFIIQQRAVHGLDFGHPLPPEFFRVYQANIGSSVPEIFSKAPENPLGPGNARVNQPYLFTQDNLLTSSLDALGIEGYAGRKLYHEKRKNQTILENKGDEKALIPKQFLR